MSSQVAFTLLVALVALERLAELVLARRHTAWALAAGGREYGAGHYPVMVVLHSALLIGALAEVWLSGRMFPSYGWAMLALVLGAQSLRWWCIATLGRQWNTKVLVVPGAPLVNGGPYRWVRHPNYVAVVIEGFALPLVHAAWWTAALFTAANAVLLRHRIRVEDRALRAPGAR